MRILIIIFFLFGCQEDSLLLDKQDFSIKYPVHLTLDESGKGNTTFILTDKKESEDDIFVENITLISLNIKGLSFERFVKQAKNEVQSYGKLIESKTLNVNETNCLRLVANTTQNEHEFTTIQDLYYKDEIAYVLTFTSENKSFDKYYPLMNKIMMSFKIK